MEGMGSFELAGVGRRRGHAHRRAHAAHRRPGLGLQDHGHRRPRRVRAPGRRRRGARPASSRARPTLPGRAPGLLHRAQPATASGRSSYVGGDRHRHRVRQRPQPRGRRRRVAALRASTRASATFLATATRLPDGRESKDGLGGQASYVFDSKPVLFITQMEHYDRGFQMDTAFLNQVGITQGWTFVAPSFYPDAKKHPWFKRVVPFVFTQYGHDRIQGGNRGSSCPACACTSRGRGSSASTASSGRSRGCSRRSARATSASFGQAQFTRWLNVVRPARRRPLDLLRRGRSLPRPPTAAYYAEVSLQPSARLNQTVSYDRVEFDRLTDGSRVYTVNVLNTRTTFQLNRHFFLRAIVQYDSSLPTGPHRLPRLLGAAAGHGGLRRVRVAHRAAVLGRSAVPSHLGRVPHDGARPLLQGLVRASVLRLASAVRSRGYCLPEGPASFLRV